MAKMRSRVKRIPVKLEKLLNDMSRKNKIKFVEAGEVAADMLIGMKGRKRVEKITKEIEF